MFYKEINISNFQFREIYWDYFFNMHTYFCCPNIFNTDNLANISTLVNFNV